MANHLFEEASRALSRILDNPHASHGPSLASTATNADALPPAADDLRKKAIALFDSRRRRLDFFARAIFNEPAWDILLALYIRAWTHSPLSIATLSQVVGTPPSSTLRWVGYLARERLIERIDTPQDRRTTQVGISPKGWQILNDYLKGEIG